MNRQEVLQAEHQERAMRGRIDSALPLLGRRRRKYGKLIFLVILLLVIAGLAGWFMYGAR
ncbi:MAG: hypothetical protein PHU80_05715 [Kiritimatiellae bacterium]|nr:hypothetical protein [Kiritimatiellia bacterium]